MTYIVESIAPTAAPRWPPSISMFSIVVVTFAVGLLAGISVASAAFGDHPICRGSIEKWEYSVVLPCEHWDAPTPRVVDLRRVP